MSTSIDRRDKKSYHHGDLRRALLSESKRLLEERGPAALSLREVARRAGVSQAAPYRHFDGKEGLLAALATEGFQELGRRTRAQSVPSDDPLEALFGVGQAYVRFAMENPSIYPLMFGSVRKRREPAVAAAGESAFGALLESVRACQAAGCIRAGDPLPIAFTATSLCHGIASFWLDGRAPETGPPEAYIRLALEQLVDGVGRAR